MQSGHAPQHSRIEAVEAGGNAFRHFQHGGKRAEFAERRDRCLKAGPVPGADRNALDRIRIGKNTGDDFLTLDRIERTIRKTSVPPGFSNVSACRSSRSCSAASLAISSGPLVHNTSGCRRVVPVEEQGASSRIASKRSAGSNVVRSAAIVSASRPSRSRFERSRLSRFSDWSSAVTAPPARMSCAVLPPGAAQRSAVRLPERSPKSFAGMLAAAS